MKAQLIAVMDKVAFRKVHVEAELAKLDGGGWRPLRPAQLRELGLTP